MLHFTVYLLRCLSFDLPSIAVHEVDYKVKVKANQVRISAVVEARMPTVRGLVQTQYFMFIVCVLRTRSITLAQ